MQLAVFSPAQTGHLRDFLVHFEALGLEGFGGFGRELEGQFPGEQVQALSLRFEGFMQAFGTILRKGFSPGLGRQRVETVQLGDQLRLFAQESIQGKLMLIAGG